MTSLSGGDLQYTGAVPIRVVLADTGVEELELWPSTLFPDSDGAVAAAEPIPLSRVGELVEEELPEEGAL